jgi:NADH-quinone oxidoreductase subunit C
MPDFQQLVDIVKAIAPDLQVDERTTPKTIILSSSQLRPVCHELHANPALYFDMLSCITGIDNGPQVSTLEVVYTLYSIPYHLHLMIKVVLPREGSEVESVSNIWRSANWLEREVYDMFGITFTGHPDLRRILMPADWEGYPLRKDYAQQEYYRNVKVKYE